MPYKDPEKNREASKLRQRKWRIDPNNRLIGVLRNREIRERPGKKEQYKARRKIYEAENPEAIERTRKKHQPRKQEKAKKRYHTDPEVRRKAIEASVWSSRQKKYGITRDDWNRILANQNNGCGICGIPRNPNGRSLSVDHCHKTMQIRGILCHGCNLLLGHGREDTEIFTKAIRYLQGRLG